MSFRLFLTAAEKNHSFANYFVGECYQYGCGTPINEQFALECYQIVASKNFTAGQYAVGYFYENGISIERNERMAIYWYKKAIDNRCHDAKKSLDKLLRKSTINKLSTFFSKKTK